METSAPNLPTSSQPLVVITQDQRPPAVLAGLLPIRTTAIESGIGLTVILSALDAESAKITAKRRHDAQGAWRTLSLAVEAMNDGYRFDDATAAPKLMAMGKAVQVLERELPLLLKALGGV